MKQCLQVFLHQLAIWLLISSIGCKKAISNTGGSGSGGTDTTTRTDPPVAATIGFFMDDWLPRNFTAPAYIDTTVPATASYNITVNNATVISKIPPTLFGNNTNTWMTQMVTEPTLLNHITQLKPGYLRGPGGSISDIFFWNANRNSPPADAPVTFVKADGTTEAANFWYGKNTDHWTMSVNNYYNVLQQTNSKGIITVNYGYARYGTSSNPVAAAAHLAADWVRFDNGRTKYWEVGNENFGEWEAGYRINLANNKDGQPEIITGDLYGRHFKVFADSMRKAAQEIGSSIKIGAVLVEATPQAWNTNTIKTWNAGVLTQAGNVADFFVVHNYFTNFNTNAPAAEILATAATESSKMMSYVKQSLQNAGLPNKPVALTEWNIFSTGSMQQVSHIAGVHAVMVLGELIKNGYGQASRWDLANGWDNGNDHGLFNIGDEPGGVPKWNPRPAFYHMYFFQKMLGDRLISSTTTNQSIFDTYASSFTSGEVGVTIVNKSTQAHTVSIQVQNFQVGNRYYWYTLAGGTDNGELSRKVFVNGRGTTHASGGPADYATSKAYAAGTQNGIRVTVPARGVVNLVIEKK
ncbi:alpha-L-arabinofuranosidase [Aridibaculum aurantiacum]|uniref:alpha-L-arabinofuranosidase n=1 Tax=Aridibaculum aurantiacum TaxID=2810307 RepID=UPI001A971704|nr:alpha-L-arabinofuranosidase [Aridibaculum aurantiacum]